MGWSIGEHNGRDIGYGVPATCDHPGCGGDIDGGLDYVCGGEPYGGEHGCGLFFCGEHRHFAGRRRDYAQLCSCCWGGKGRAFEPTPDVQEWINHKMTDASWSAWRAEHPEWVAKHTTPNPPISG